MEHLATKIGIRGATLRRLLGVKDYRATLDFLFLIMDSAIITQLQMFIEFMQNEKKNETLDACLNEIKNLDWQDKEKRKEVVEMAVRQIQNFSQEFFSFSDLLSERSENFKLLNSFVWDDMSSLLQLLLAIQSGDLKKSTIAMKRMNRYMRQTSIKIQLSVYF